MRIGCCVNMVARDSEGIGYGRIPVLWEAGYDYVELPLAQIMSLDRGRFRELTEVLGQFPLPCDVCNNFIPATMRLTGHAVMPRAQVRDYMERAVERASRIGAETIVFGSAGAKNIPEGFQKEEAVKQIVECFHLAADIVENTGIQIVIEPICFLESNIIRTVEEGYHLWKTVNRPQVKLLADYYHMAVEREPVSHLENAAEAIGHLHFADPAGRRFPYHSGADIYSDFFEALKRTGYQGKMSIEAFAENFEKEAPLALKAIKSIMA